MGEVVNYKEGRYCQLKLDSGERILISIAQSGIKIVKLSFGGLIPTSTIWNCSIADVRKAINLFVDQEELLIHPLDAIKGKLIDFKSIADVKSFLHGSDVERG